MRDFIHMYFWQIENSNQGYLVVVVVVPCVVSSSIWDHLKNKQQESFLDIPDVPNGSPETCSTCQLVYDLTNLNLVFYVHKYIHTSNIKIEFVIVVECTSSRKRFLAYYGWQTSLKPKNKSGCNPQI